MIVDSHAHAFPDALAPRALAALSAGSGGQHHHLDGTISDLRKSLQRNGIDAAVVACIATRPAQFGGILDWCREIAAPDIVPFPSVHPDDPELLPHLDAIAAGGFRGIKLHPYYQGFSLTEVRLEPLYQRCSELGLVLLCHTGFDIAYPRERFCDPVRIAAVIGRFPRLKFVATHLGAWADWDEVETHLLGRNVYLDTAFVYPFLGHDRMRGMLLRHPAEYLLFGSDTPWDDHATVLAQLRGLQLPAAHEAALLGGNAARLLGLTRC